MVTELVTKTSSSLAKFLTDRCRIAEIRLQFTCVGVLNNCYFKKTLSSAVAIEFPLLCSAASTLFIIVATIALAVS